MGMYIAYKPSDSAARTAELNLARGPQLVPLIPITIETPAAARVIHHRDARVLGVARDVDRLARRWPLPAHASRPARPPGAAGASQLSGRPITGEFPKVSRQAGLPTLNW